MEYPVVCKAIFWKKKILQSSLHLPSTLLTFDRLRMSWPNKVHGCITSTQFFANSRVLCKFRWPYASQYSSGYTVKEDLHCWCFVRYLWWWDIYSCSHNSPHRTIFNYNANNYFLIHFIIIIIILLPFTIIPPGKGFCCWEWEAQEAPPCLPSALPDSKGSGISKGCKRASVFFYRPILDLVARELREGEGWRQTEIIQLNSIRVHQSN